MYYEVYIDVVFVTNILMDYILLRLVGKLFRCRRTRGRSLLAAAVGALFSCFILYVQMDGFLPVVILLHGACAMGMIRTGLGLKKGSLLVKAMLAMYLMAFLLGGFLEAAAAGTEMTWKMFGLLAVSAYLGLSGLMYLSDSVRAQRKNIYPLTLSYQGKVQSAYGYYDTGNLLSDPVSGAPVSVMKPELLETMLPGELLDGLKHLNENPGEAESTELVLLKPRFLPYRTVGQEEGVMLAITLEDLCIHTPGEVIHVSAPVFALAFEPSALGKEYKVLLNSRLLH